MSIEKEVARKTKSGESQSLLFDLPPDWKAEWWGMPSFQMADATPTYRIVVNFLTAEDVAEFSKRLGLGITTQCDSTWFPKQKPLNGSIEYAGPKTDSKYPVCIPSKGRADCHKTPRALDQLGVRYWVFVEDKEYDSYARYLPEEKLVRLPFSDLGQGSIPARNYIWEWAKAKGVARHWTVDDNIVSFARCTNNRRLCVRGGGFFRAMEDFVDRYENIAMAGPHDKGFVPDRESDLAPYLLNSRVYSCILLDTSLPYRWRGRYNEDTDLSLRLLKDGYCTILFRALLMDKGSTARGDGTGGLKGGNTDTVYATGDHRREFAESLKRQHPDVVEVTWKFGRWHHQVDYSPFKNNRLKPKVGITPTGANNDYGMTLRRR